MSDEGIELSKMNTGLAEDGITSKERYYYASFSYLARKTDGFGNIVTKVVSSPVNPEADFIPSTTAKKIMRENSVHGVTIMNWIEMTKTQYLLESEARVD